MLLNKKIIVHFKKYQKLSLWPFCWHIALEASIVNIVVIYVLFALFPLVPRKDLLGFNLSSLIIGALVVAPILETLLLQVLPISIAKTLHAPFSWQILVSVIPFAIMHFFSGIATGIGSGLIDGFYLAFVYIHWSKVSIWTGFWTTALTHMIRNFIGLVLFLPQFMYQN